MSNKHKGSNNERELLKMFSENGWRAARVAGSGVNDESPCDIIAGKVGKKLAIECKSTRKNIQYISKDQINDFIVFASMMGLKPIIALKFLREGWLFIEPKNLRDTGNNWAISLEDAKKSGKRLGQLIS
ncbi:Holliday junction resolvase [Candidatus Pacearchaeota archaeon]|nr:Holliday junction resolvase [Candidatus Pacearchaeota archaeon]